MNGEVTHDQMEPKAFSAITPRSQAVLAQILREKHDYQQSQVQADEAMRTCFALIGLFPKLPEYTGEAARCALVLTEGSTTKNSLSPSQLKLCGEVLASLEKHMSGRDVPQAITDLKTQLENNIETLSLELP